MVKSTSKTKTSGAAGVLKQKKAPDTPKSEEPRHLYLMRHGKSAKAKKRPKTLYARWENGEGRT